jgi:hypothetical protein
MAKKSNKVIDTAQEAGIKTGEVINKSNVQINRPKGRVLSSAAGFFHFDEQHDTFVGRPIGTTVHDPKDVDKEGNFTNKLVGYDFVTEDGEPVVIGATNAIQKAMDMETVDSTGKSVPIFKSESRVSIRWAGKIELKNGQTFNKFEIILLD